MEDTKEKTEEQKQPSEQKNYANSRFEFTVYVNDNVICRRNFRINYFNEQSMYSLQMLDAMDGIVREIQDDLAAKSRIYVWYYYDENLKDDLTEPLPEEWTYTFRVEVTDNGRLMYSKIFDGRYYPKAIRDKIELTNRYITVKDKRIELSQLDPNRIGFETNMQLKFIKDRKDLMMGAVRTICDTCSPTSLSTDADGNVVKHGEFTSDSDYDLYDIYRTTDAEGNVIDEKKYTLSRSFRYMKMASDWSKNIGDKTKRYFNEECWGMFNGERRRSGDR